MVKYSTLKLNKGGIRALEVVKGIRPRYVAIFNGTDGYIDAGNNANLSFGAAQDFTISVWLNHGNQDGNILSKGGVAGGTGYRFLLSGSLVQILLTGDVAKSVTGTITVNTNAWHHVASVADRDGNLTLYIDGILSGPPIAISTVGNIDVATNFVVGARAGGADRFFKGNIKEVRIYNRALTASEIALLHGGLDIQDSALVLHHNYALGHARDISSGHNNNGTLVNGVKFSIVNYEEV